VSTFFLPKYDYINFKLSGVQGDIKIGSEVLGSTFRVGLSEYP